MPDDQNAWLPFAQAIARKTADSPASTQLDYPPYPPFGTAWEKMVATSEQANAAVFPLARQARGRSRAQFPSTLARPIVLTMPPHLNTSRNLANTLVDGAMHRHLTGDDDEALERLRDTLHLAATLQQEQFIVSQWVAIGVMAQATNRTLMIAPGLRLDAPEARRATVALIAELLDDEPAMQAFRRSVAFERLVHADYARFRSDGTWFIRPLADLTLAKANEEAAVNVAAAAMDDAPSAAAIFQPAEAAHAADRARRPDTLFGSTNNWAKVPRYSLWFDEGSFGMTRVVEQMFRIRGERRAAAISLAVQLYRADHRGQWPRKLQQLVPTYLTAVPVDPYRADRGPMGYVILPGGLPDGSGRPLVYYEAGIDAPTALDTEPLYQWRTGQNPDGSRLRSEVRQYRDLARWSPAKRRFDEYLASQAVENDPQQPDAPGDQTEKQDDPQQ